MIKRFSKVLVVGLLALSITITATAPLKKEEVLKEAFYESISWVESTKNPNAVSRDGSVGIVQIRPIMVKEVNRICDIKGIEKTFSLSDRRDITKSKEMFWIYQEFYNPEINWETLSQKDLETLARKWNGGPKGHIKKATEKYWNKVNKRLKHEIENVKLSSR